MQACKYLDALHVIYVAAIKAGCPSWSKDASAYESESKSDILRRTNPRLRRMLSWKVGLPRGGAVMRRCGKNPIERHQYGHETARDESSGVLTAHAFVEGRAHGWW